MEPTFKSDLKEYISKCKARLGKILKGLNWTEAATEKEYNTNSIASSSRPALKRPCSANKSTFPNSCVTENSVILDTEKLQALLKNNTSKAPDNFIELQGNFSPEQKLQLYKHAIDNTRKQESILLDNDVEGEVSLADILAQKKREEKRKKRRFRKSKPTHMEEVRCLVDLQMQSLEQFLGNKIQKEEETTLQRRSFKENEYRNEIKYPGKGSVKEYDRKHQRRSCSKEPLSHKRSSFNEFSSARKMEFKSHERSRRGRSISSKEDIRQDRKKHRSKSRHKSKERRKHRKRSRSQSRKVSKEKKYRSKRRSRSRDKNTSRECSDYDKYSSRKEFATYSKYPKKEYKSYRNQSNSPENYTKKYKAEKKN